MGENAVGENIDDSTMAKKLRLSASLDNNLNQGESSENQLASKADLPDEDSDEGTIPADEYAAEASKVKSGDGDFQSTSNNTMTNSFTSSGSKQQHQESENKVLWYSDRSPTSFTRKAEQGERQMEANRVRAREIRKRKKNMIEEMQKKIVKLTMANQQLISQTQIQHAEIHMLRSTQGFIPNHSVSIPC